MNAEFQLLSTTLAEQIKYHEEQLKDYAQQIAHHQNKLEELKGVHNQLQKMQAKWSR